MADNNLKYEQINWGWLNDYSGYKFAPLTFYEKLYTEEGKPFKNVYEQFIQDLKDGTFVVGNSQSLIKVNSDGSRSPYFSDPNPSHPIYFNNQGQPMLCMSPLTIDLVGNINKGYFEEKNNEKEKSFIEYKNYEIYGGYIQGDKIRSVNANGQDTIISGGNVNTNIIRADKIYIPKNSTNSKYSTLIEDGAITVHGTVTANTFIGNLNGVADKAKMLVDANGTTPTAAGLISEPVYFKNGIPYVCNTPKQSTNWLGVVKIDASSTSGEGGIMEIGKYIDFHATDTTDADYTTRLCCGTESDVLIELPKETGTLALTTDATPVNVIQATDGGASTRYFTAVGSAGKNTDLYYYTSIGVEQDPSDNQAVIMGAAWNDYAEYRRQSEEIDAGYCAYSNNNGILSKTTERLQSCDGIVSDTYGFTIGKTEECQTPLAVAGRVLAFYGDDISIYESGDAVCAGPEGKIYKMTDEEIVKYPHRIIGTVSEIPAYEKWNNKNTNGRIWIKVK